MAKKSTPTTAVATQNHGMMFVITFFTIFVTSCIILYLMQMLFPQYIVIGTHALGYYWGIGMSMGKLSLIATLAVPFVTEYEMRRKKIFSSAEWMIFYFFLNFITLWVITRFSEQFGLGVTSWVVVAALAFVLDMAQGIAMMTVPKMLMK